MVFMKKLVSISLFGVFFFVKLAVVFFFLLFSILVSIRGTWLGKLTTSVHLEISFQLLGNVFILEKKFREMFFPFLNCLFPFLLRKKSISFSFSLGRIGDRGEFSGCAVLDESSCHGPQLRVRAEAVNKRRGGDTSLSSVEGGGRDAGRFLHPPRPLCPINWLKMD